MEARIDVAMIVLSAYRTPISSDRERQGEQIDGVSSWRNDSLHWNTGSYYVGAEFGKSKWGQTEREYSTIL